MSRHRYRPVYQAAVTLAVTWLLAISGYRFAQHFAVSPGEVNRYAASTAITRLAGADRSAALRRLEQMINSLSDDDQQQISLQTIAQWRDAMTPKELEQFRAATAESGFRLPNEIDELPPEQREKALEARLQKLREGRAAYDRNAEAPVGNDTNRPAVPN